MRRKRLCSLVLVLLLAVTTYHFAAPATPASADGPWSPQPLPGSAGMVIANGSDVSHIAVTPANSSVVYAIDSHTAPNTIYRSNDGGSTFAPVNIPVGTTLRSLTVAPDDANVIAVTDRTSVYVSSDCGAIWNTLWGIPPEYAGTHVLGLAVGPANPGMLLGRKYAVALGDPAAGSTARGNVMVLVNGSTPGTVVWSGGGPQVKGVRDYVDVKFTPNSDNFLAALGVTTVAGSATVQVINMAAKLVISTAFLAPTGTTTDYVNPTAPTAIASGGIQLPSDFDVTTSSGRRGYASLRSGSTGMPPPADNDVYRFDDTAAIALGAGVGRVMGISYSGTIAAGTIFAGAADSAIVKYTKSMASSSPTWTTTQKLLPTSTINTRVRVAADFATSQKVFVGTTGTDSAFSISTDGGATFSQKSLIDYGSNTVATVNNLALSAGTVFMATRSPSGSLSLWKSATPPTSSSWSRIFVTPSTGSGNVRVSTGFATDSTLYFFDLSPTGSIYRSGDGGATFSPRLPPPGVAGSAISASAVAVADATTLYIGETGATPKIYRSTSGALSWDAGVAPNVGAIRQAVIPKAGALLLGGTGAIAYSTDGGQSFPTLISGNPGEAYRVVASSTFVTDSTIFAADAAGITGKVYRHISGTDPGLVDLLTPVPSGTTPSVRGLGLRSGALYAQYGGTVGNVFNRTVNPMASPGTTVWATRAGPTGVTGPLGINLLVVTSPNNTLWVTDNVGVWTYLDSRVLATVTLGNLNQTYDGTPKSATTTTTPPGLSVALTYDGSPTPPTNVGSYALAATVNDPTYWGSASGTLVIAKAAQTITFAALADKLFGDDDFTVNAVATSGLPVTYTASGACTISGNIVHITGLGSCTVTAQQAGDANYNAAAVSRTFTVGITYDRLRELVEEYVTKKGIINSLSAKLDAAEAAQARGDLEAKAGITGAFINEVEAQTSKSISQEDAAVLIALARAL